MTFAEVLEWCQKQKAEVRGHRPWHGDHDLAQRPTTPANLPPMSKVLHWDLEIGGLEPLHQRLRHGANGRRQDDRRPVQRHIARRG